MNKTYYFLSGLPRSGSSLLSAILNQNPDFYCGPSSPVVGSMISIEQSLESSDLYRAYPKPKFIKGMMKHALEEYYADVDKPVIFDKNRSWTHRVEYIEKYFGIKDAKIICTVRNLEEILASFISLIHKSDSKKFNFIDNNLSNMGAPINDFTRCQHIASDGPMGRAYTGLKTAFENGFAKNLLIVEYNDIVSNPKDTMQKIYEFIGQKQFIHDFNNIYNKQREDDGKVYGLPEMHKVRAKLQKTAKKPSGILPEQVIKDVSGLEFWRQ